MLIFCGGLPQEHSGDHHAITIMHGVQHVALDFSSPVVDIFAINGELIYDQSLIGCHRQQDGLVNEVMKFSLAMLGWYDHCDEVVFISMLCFANQQEGIPYVCLNLLIDFSMSIMCG